MDEKNSVETVPVNVVVERRRDRSAEMTCAEIMKILRKRRAKAARREAQAIDADPEQERTL